MTATVTAAQIAQIATWLTTVDDQTFAQVRGATFPTSLRDLAGNLREVTADEAQMMRLVKAESRRRGC